MQLFLTFLLLMFSYMFLSSSFEKMVNFKQHVTTVQAYQVVPVHRAHIFALIDISIELVVGLSFLVFIALPYSLILGTMLLMVYSGVIVLNLLKGRLDLDCGCGGIVGETKISYKLVIRNLSFGAVLIVLFYNQTSLLKVFSFEYMMINLFIIQMVITRISWLYVKKTGSHYKQIGG
ncbi:MauE/DoxX family redox-associated membrane protein [Exiguobacterium sp. s142]|uniref:MauE/DoxX family redox-associated membrane protein n=1 Tax=Exiguobacterium sp. s142 TaxID=2751222 RepID=UPI001BE5B340|nr:MauE/DoxX family redox-associated membrane protein [Exiguobacterium sp. s142]